MFYHLVVCITIIFMQHFYCTFLLNYVNFVYVEPLFSTPGYQPEDFVLSFFYLRQICVFRIFLANIMIFV